ncbi:ABC transporter permease [Phaeacidiphilus oryzae]|uniref:ABC transporter permease n=1 Tax=Phaeacidiphilus oryzae TaxID=348818 RepID=UPI000689957C|nr:ABC transporter permease [Phaeacidiphilus oryzae]
MNPTAPAAATAPGQTGRRLEHQIFRSQRSGLPHLPTYLRQLWQRRQFVLEMARSTLRAQNYATFFGQLWLVISPLLLGFVYFMLGDVLGNAAKHQQYYFVTLLSGLFLFNFFSGCLTQGAGSVIGSSRLIMNSHFPRLLLPITQFVIAFMRFLPSLLVFVVVHWLQHVPWSVNAVWALPAFLCVALFGAGLGFLFATVQVYFRDFSNFLPYLMRIWLFLSPVMYSLEQGLHKGRTEALIIGANPISPMLGVWGDALVRNKPANLHWLLAGGCWALGAFVVGTFAFMWKEREFSVRL